MGDIFISYAKADRLSLAPARRLNRRFVFILLGLALLLGLNWLSTPNLAAYLKVTAAPLTNSAGLR